MSKTLTLSVIIPVYNEAHRLGACLDALAQQSEAPDEVLLVDNNSTDNSIAIAKKYNFVTILHEPVQGLIPARNKGFDVATGTLLARIDADTIVSSNWVKTIKQSFNNQKISGLTGPSYSLLLPRIHKPMTKLWSSLYFFWTKVFYRVPVLWGANMVITRDIWQKIRQDVCLDGDIVHEDHDISLLIHAMGKKIVLNNEFDFISYSQAYHYFPKLIKYTQMRHSTRRHHQDRGSFVSIKPEVPKYMRFFMYLVGWPIIFIFYLASFLMWPIDFVMKKRGTLDDWLS